MSSLPGFLPSGRRGPGNLNYEYKIPRYSFGIRGMTKQEQVRYINTIQQPTPH